MKRFSCGLLILSILLLSLTGALAEPVTDDVPGTVSLVYSYGEDAHERHMDDVKNTVLFQGMPMNSRISISNSNAPASCTAGRRAPCSSSPRPNHFRRLKPSTTACIWGESA